MRFTLLVSALFFVGVLQVAKTQDDEKDDIIDVNTDDALSMDQKEKDKLLACTELAAMKTKKDQKTIEDVVGLLRGRVDQDQVSNKITGDIFNKCYYSIDDYTVASIFMDGIFMEPDFSDDLLEFVAIDYSAYKLLNPPEFQLSPETQMLFMKVEKAREEYMEFAKARQERSKNEFKFFGYNLQNMPVGINLFISFAVLGASVGGLLILLKVVMSDNRKAAGKKLAKNEDKKKKK